MAKQPEDDEEEFDVAELAQIRKKPFARMPKNFASKTPPLKVTGTRLVLLIVGILAGLMLAGVGLFLAFRYLIPRGGG